MNYRYHFYTSIYRDGKYYFFNSYSSISYGLKAIKKVLSSSPFTSCSVKVSRFSYAFQDPDFVKYYDVEV